MSASIFIAKIYYKKRILLYQYLFYSIPHFSILNLVVPYVWFYKIYCYNIKILLEELPYNFWYNWNCICKVFNEDEPELFMLEISYYSTSDYDDSKAECNVFVEIIMSSYKNEYEEFGP